jgi:hypothetical protein
VKRRREHHGVVGPEPGKFLIAPVGSELRRQLGMIFLRADKTRTAFQFSNNHVSPLDLSRETK